MSEHADQTMIMLIRPRYESANIGTWVGFKQLMYIVEEAVVQWFRERGMGPQHVHHEYGLGLEVIDCSVLLLALVEIDDEIVAEITQRQLGRYSIRLRIRRNGAVVLALKSKICVALVPEKEASGMKSVPDKIKPFVVPNVSVMTVESDRRDIRIADHDDDQSALIRHDSKAFVWSWRARYFHCHYSSRVQHSAYVRALEETVDRFLTTRGLSVPQMLAERGWIPIVSRARVRMLADAYMDETVHTTFVVEDVFKGTVYNARMNCYVRRGDLYAHTASARILHGYAKARGERSGQLVELDARTISALTAEAWA